MKILHWNIHGWRDADGNDNVERVTQLIHQEDPDVVSLVEVDEAWNQTTAVEHVADKLGYHWCFIPAFEYQGAGGFGNALLSRQPFLWIQHRHLISPRDYNGTEPSENRTVTLAGIAAEEDALIIGTTHFPRSSDGERRTATNQLLDIVSSLDRPSVVCGDFNQAPETWPSLSPPWSLAASGNTYPATSPSETIDYCLTSIRRVTVEPLKAESSDHLPVVVEAQHQ